MPASPLGDDTAPDGCRPHWQEALIFGFIWAIVGAIYGAILVAMLAFFRHLEVGSLGVGLAASLAGAAGALFYGSLRLAFLATIAALIASFGYLTVFPMQAISPLAMLAVSGLAGVIVGSHYGYLIKGSRVRQATGKALAGLYAGFVAGMPLAAVIALYGEVETGVAAATLTPLTGLVYVLSVRRVVALLQDQPPAPWSGALAGGGVAGLIGIAVWAFAGIFNSTITATATDAVRFAWAELPQAALGGMIGGFLAGAAVAAVGLRWLNDR
jgi:hypothetical protein